MFSPIVFDFGELDSVFIASIIGVHICLSYNAQRMVKLATMPVYAYIYTSMTFPTIS